MRGTKRKIAMEKIEKKDYRSVAFSKRRNGLYSKASDLCTLSGAQIAILSTPISSNSNVAFYSYGHSSVDSVVSAFLADEVPLKSEELGFWFEKENLIENLNDPNELCEAMDSVTRMLQELKGMCTDLGDCEDVKKKKNKKKRNKKKKKVSENQALIIHQSSSTSHCTQELSDSPANFEGFVEKEENQIVLVSENLDDVCNQESDDFVKFIDFVMNSEDNLDFEDDEVSKNQNQFSDSKLVEEEVTKYQTRFSDYEAIEDEALLIQRDSDADQIKPITNNTNDASSPRDLDVCNQELDVDQFIDFEIDEVSMNEVLDVCSDSKLVEDEALLMHKDSDHEDQITPITDNNKKASLGELDEINKEIDLTWMNLEMEDDSVMKMSQKLFFDSEDEEDSLHLYDVFKAIAPL